MAIDVSAGLNGAFASGVQGYRNASEGMAQASSQFAQANRQDIDVNTAAVTMLQSSLQAQASAEVIQRSDSMLGSIIDVFV
jgi:hypothetical protein